MFFCCESFCALSSRGSLSSALASVLVSSVFQLHKFLVRTTLSYFYVKIEEDRDSGILRTLDLQRHKNDKAHTFLWTRDYILSLPFFVLIRFQTKIIMLPAYLFDSLSVIWRVPYQLSVWLGADGLVELTVTLEPAIATVCLHLQWLERENKCQVFIFL